ncbi:Carboxylesterase family [Nesidiocoris tenuis]|uniref:Carboxylesterase family n=1 Tax=Nesidiocoris tenuis TaxID=355587 RepID=A0ABN7AT29_9HEMI|nr:Carboxylesterase family [Nesidiocoris tenuis]
MPLPFHVLLLLLATGASGGWIEKGKTREVHIQQGLIRGFVAGWDNPNLRPVQIFLGIPYAAAPVGSLRYMPPQSPQTWGNEDGPVKMALDYAPVCPQILPTIDRDRKKMTVGHANYLKRLISYLKVQSEDCLTLNIFAPLQGWYYRSSL